MKTFNPYAKGIPEKKESKAKSESRYQSISQRDDKSGSMMGGPRTSGAGFDSAVTRPAVSPDRGTSRVSSDTRPASPTSATTQPDVTARQANIGRFNAGTHGELERRNAQKPDRDLLDGLESSMRRTRGWGDDEKPNELVDGISITPISKADLKKKLADQKRGGFATNV